MKYGFTSDLHLGHKNITGKKLSNWKSGYRNFDSIEEMNTIIINGINNNFDKDDIVFILGDISLEDNDKILEYLRLINCKVIIIDGNHDRHLSTVKPPSHCKIIGWNGKTNAFGVSVKQSLSMRVKIEEQYIFMSHYKHAIWEMSHRGCWHLYGHSHSTAENTVIGRSMDVGVDNAYKLLGEYRPFYFSEIKELMEKRPMQIIDHHSSERV